MSESCLEFYRGDSARYDELLSAEGIAREHWRPLIARLSATGPDGIKRGVELARRLIVENGVTYNVYADPQGRDRPWVLDPLPLVIPADEWRTIAAGVAQRASVLNRLLADLYGPQKLIANGVIPAELAFGHPNYLWPCCNVEPLGKRWLHVYAVDLARAPDGRWWVMSDRTQTPSGAGYALENREIVERIYPDLLRDMRVQPIEGFFSALREQMLSLVPSHSDEAPLAVVLTPGPFNETYFEHVYLARQLGLPLVEGADLTVRDATVYLKTMSGLRRVHSIFRRLDDDYCDPVELRSDSALGIPGLLTAVRADRVLLANALGVGVLESPAWQGFLPGAAEWLVDEQLTLPSIATWWCGERPALEYVLTHLDQLVVKGCFPNQRFEAVFGSELSHRQRTELKERLRAHPHAYVAQERFKLSQAPSWRSADQAGSVMGMTARSLTLRVYAIASDEGYRVLPGGLARIAAEGSANIVSSQRGGSSKDVWVLAQDDVDDVPRQSVPATGISIVRHDEFPSRLDENLFWLGRYTERCEYKTRLLRTMLASRSQVESWASALATCRYFGVLEAAVLEDESGIHQFSSQSFSDPSFSDPSCFDPNNSLGLPADVKRLSWCATQVRSRLSSEQWRTVNLLQRQLQEATCTPIEPREALDRLLLSLTAFSGLALDDMTRDSGWCFYMLGRHLERIQFLCDLIRLQLDSDTQPPSQKELEWLLDVNGSTVAYRARYRSTPSIAPTMDLMISDDTNPRSLKFQHIAAAGIFAALAKSVGADIEDELRVPIDALFESDFGALQGVGQGATYARQSLSVALNQLSVAGNLVASRIANRYFAHVDTRTQTVES